MDNIEGKICQAIDIIVQRAISQAGYDKTIQATISKCVDETIGKYAVRYQDSTFYAYSNSLDVSYNNGTLVYILVPSNDMSKDKTIIGAVEKLGTDFISNDLEINKYDIIGDNCIKDNDKIFSLKSYFPSNTVHVLYEKNRDQNEIDINEKSLLEYLKEADNIICSATFKTALPAEQQFNGNYGLLIALDFKDNSTGQEITREYVIDVNNMQGNPYRLINDTKQSCVFNIDSTNFLGVNYISIFCYGFPHNKSEEECIEDIWIKDIELNAAIRLSEEELNGYAISFITPRGICFDRLHSEIDTLTVQAQVKVKNKVVDSNSQNIDYYWFVEDVYVTNQSEKYYKYYNQYGGQGWRCLNLSNLITSENDNERATVQWVPAQDTLNIIKKEVVAKETLFKCAAVYNGIVISKKIIIKRLDSEWDISIESSNGTTFYFDNGKTNITCLVNNQNEPNDCVYCWAKINQNNYFETLSETQKINDNYNEKLKEYNDLQRNIKNETVLVSESKSKLEQLERDLAEFDKTTRVDKNTIYNLSGEDIDRICTIKCSVYKNNIFLGTSSIVLTNQLSAEGTWTLVIHNGEQIFKYNEYGISPTDSSNLKLISTESLTFSLYDNLGNQINEDAIDSNNVKWTIPIVNTMLVSPLNEEAPYIDNEDGTRTYSGIKIFPYKIADSYNVNNQRNNIKLEVIYKNMYLNTTTNFLFTKQGDAGTNGSDYVCRIVPNCADPFVNIPMAIMNAATQQVEWNFIPDEKNIPFKVQLWHNGELIFNNYIPGNSSEGHDVKIEWSILKNTYAYSLEDSSSFTIVKDTGELTYLDFKEDNPANIIQVKVEHNDVVYYATVPIITAFVQSGYKIKLKEGTGFNYVIYTSDGKQPSYDNSTPFEIIVTQTIDGWDEDISLKESSQYKIDYQWDILGSIVQGDEKQLIDVRNLIVNTYYNKNLNKNQRAFKVVDSYDGQCVNNAIECVAMRSNEAVAKIHIPIHFMLNRYGNSSINGWNGNSVNIDPNGGFILAPQAGAGKKESDNSFTGVLMGKVKEGLKKEENGLFGYYKGQRSIFLDAETGTAKFGLNGIGQIIIDPTSSVAKIYSGNYSEDDKTGLLIDLTTPEIKFGSGNFSVDKDGKLTAKGDGSNIGGCIIEGGVLKVPSAQIKGQLTAEQIAVGAITVSGLDESLRDMINKATSKVEVLYALGDTTTTPPTSQWSPAAPPWTPGKYMWQKTVTTSSDGNILESDATCISGAIGQTGVPGEKGAAGKGVKSVVPQYYLSTSPTGQSGGSWSDNQPSWASGRYIWTRSYVTFDDGTFTTTTPILAKALNDANSTAASAQSTASSVDKVIADWCYNSDRTVINGGKIFTGTITANQIAANAITSGKIAADAVTAEKISVTSLSAISANLGTITAGTIQSPTYSYSGSGNFSNSGIQIGLSGAGYLRAKNFGIDTSGNAYFKGNLQSATGSFNGDIIATNIKVKDSIYIYFSGQLSDKYYTEVMRISGFYTQNSTYFLEMGCSNDTSQVSIGTGEKISTIYIGNTSTSPHISLYGKVFENGLLLSNKYAPLTHSHNYLSTNGGTLSGTLVLPSGSVSSYPAGLRFPSGATVFATGDARHLYFLPNSSATNYILDLGINDNEWALVPYVNGYLNLGSPNHKWGTVYAIVGAIQTSDANQKNSVTPLSEQYESIFEQLKPVSYKFNNGHRTHTGFISQDIEESLENNNMTGEDWAAFCKDSDTHGDFIYGLRYEEIIALNTHMIQKLMKRIEQLEEQLNQNFK